MPDHRYSVWIEAEHWEPGDWTADDCNTDVHVFVEGGSTWMATFFTYKNILSLAAKNRVTGECMDGRYFWAADMVLVDEASRDRLEQVIEHLILVGEFERVFTRIEPSM